MALGVTVSGLGFKYFSAIPGFGAILILIVLFGILVFFFLPPKLTQKFFKYGFTFCIGVIFVCFIPKSEETYRKRNVIPLFSQSIDTLISKIPISKVEKLVVKGLVLGSVQLLPEYWKSISRQTGILHLFAASGLHLGIFMGTVYFFFRFGFSKFPIIPLLVSIGFGFLYVYALDFPVSFFRAFIFATYTMFGSFFHRKIQPVDVLLYSSASVTIFHFSDFLSVGYLLSFSAVFGIFFIKPKLDVIFFPKVKSLWKDNLHLTLSCSLSTFPFLVYYFKSFAFGGIFINYILVPYTGILLPLVYFSLGVSYLLHFFTSIENWTLFWIPLQYGLSLFLYLIPKLNHIFPFYKEWKNVPWEFCFLFSFICVLVLYVTKKKENSIYKTCIYILIYLSFVLCYMYKFEKDMSPFFTFSPGLSTIKIQEKLFVYGNCYKKLKLPHQTKINLKEVYFESESCLVQLFQIQKEIPNLKLNFLNSKAKEWKFPENSTNLKLKESLGWNLTENFSLLRFNGQKSQIPKLYSTLSHLEFTRGKKRPNEILGIIFLDFPKWKKKEETEWKKYQNLLGISSRFQILNLEEVSESPLLHKN